MNYNRQLDITTLIKKKSLFLFGPRSSGKSTLLKKLFHKKAHFIDLLRSHQLLRLSQNTSDLEAILEAQEHKLVIIDEIQKLPALLDEVHYLIENKKYRFILTGSSARKIKRGGANLLAGRAWQAELFPLTSQEIPDFNLLRYLRYGGLPHIYPSLDPEDELEAYVNTYLYEEIQAESLVRKIPAFSRFLISAATTNGEILNFTKIASDAGVPTTTVKEYYQILVDTLIGFMVEPWQESVKRKSVSTARFYFFDPGVVHTLCQRKQLDENSEDFGKSLEHFIAMEIRAYLSYQRVKERLYFWRSKHHQEVDFIIGNQVAIEVKASKKINSYDLKGLKTLKEEKIIKKYYLVSQDKLEKVKEDIHSLHYTTFLEKLWSGKIIS